MIKTILSILIALCLSQISWAQSNFDKDKLDQYFTALEENNKFMGSVAVAKNGKIIYTRSIGRADVESNIEATDQSKYRIGSISKSFTAVLTLKAVEQNKINLDDKINKWFPTIKNANKITVKQLLNHRSGIHSFTNDPTYLSWNTSEKTEKELIEIIAQSPADFEPDTKAEYSNSNYVLLTFILQTAFKKSYAKLIQEYIVKPIGLENTYVFGKINTSENECRSYTFDQSWIEESETNYSVPLGAGAIASTASELTKFADALFGGKLLNAKSLELMQTIQDGYGHGLFQIPFIKSMGFGHTGGIDGFTSVFAHFPNEKISYALTSNGSNYENNDISIAVLSAAFGEKFKIPVFTKYGVSSEDLDKYLGVYASKQIPLKITFTKNGATMIAQGTGQPALSLEAREKDLFVYDQVGAKFQFNPDKKSMILFQGGSQVEFVKE